jgi:hypothetical protein
LALEERERTDEAIESLKRAIELYEKQEDEEGLEQAKTFLDEID